MTAACRIPHNTLQEFLDSDDFPSLANPVLRLGKWVRDCFKTQPRERFIQPGYEYIKFAKALSEETNQTIQDFFWTCLFTGTRMSRLLAMEWDQIDFDLLVWQIPITKNGDSQTIPLTPNAMAILWQRFSDEENKHPKWVFPSDRKGRVFDTKAGPAPELAKYERPDLRDAKD